MIDQFFYFQDIFGSYYLSVSKRETCCTEFRPVCKGERENLMHANLTSTADYDQFLPSRHIEETIP